MLRWARTWTPPHAGLGLPRARRSTVPVSSGGQGGAGPGSVTGAPREAVLYFYPSGPTPRPTSSGWARPLPGCFHLPHPFPSGSGSPPILAPPARPGRLAYRLLDGDAVRPALVILHGLFGSQTNFSSVAKALAQQTGRRVLTVDARNHGDSFHSPEMSYEAMSQDLQDFLPQLGLVPCVLIGHSMGGRTAMLLALQRPELVERLIVEDVSPVNTIPDPDVLTYIAAMKAIDIPDKVSRSQARRLADEQLSSVVEDITLRQFLLTNLVEADGRVVWRLNLDALAQHMGKIKVFPPQQETYPRPTLFLCGGNSKFVL